MNHEPTPTSDRQQLADKARSLRSLHAGPGLLVLPNIWDPLGARLLQSLGYPAVATASAAVAFSLGYDDGEKITFDAMLAVIRPIADSVRVPLTADIERGYADSPAGVADNARRVLAAGAVGINIEDSFSEGALLRATDQQCARIAAIRAMAREAGVHMVINARTDVFIIDSSATLQDRIKETITRGKEYMAAGADCLYPIFAGDLDTVSQIVEGTGAPINIYARQGVASMSDLEAAGVRRLSLGPNLLRAALQAMRQVAVEMRGQGGYDGFGEGVITSDEIRKIVRSHKMPGKKV
ncbi:MAG: isocitrate lyase/phosphoenolpyruvate mutase family protein [Acidobacteria bacterium]|nr:MAG: isocitrate lyase/phosphoenolpyruvate mutase family protein [Acidobacteriota bacterium]